MLVLKLTELCDFRLPVRPNAIHKCWGGGLNVHGFLVPINRWGHVT